MVNTNDNNATAPAASEVSETTIVQPIEPTAPAAAISSVPVLNDHQLAQSNENKYYDQVCAKAAENTENFGFQKLLADVNMIKNEINAASSAPMMPLQAINTSSRVVSAPGDTFSFEFERIIWNTSEKI